MLWTHIIWPNMMTHLKKKTTTTATAIPNMRGKQFKLIYTAFTFVWGIRFRWSFQSDASTEAACGEVKWDDVIETLIMAATV